MVEQNEEGTFTQSLLLVIANNPRSLVATADEEVLIFGSGPNIEIYRKSGTYQLDQTLIQGGTVYGLALSEDGRELIACSNVLNAYQQEGAIFTLSQTLTLGFDCLGV